MEDVAIHARMEAPTPAEITRACRLLTALVIASQCFACGGSTRTGPADLPAAGSTSDYGGAGGTEPAGPGVTGGSGGLPSASGGLPSASGGSSMGGSTAAEGGTGGVVGTAGAGGGTGGVGEEPEKVVLFDGSSESFGQWVSVRDGRSVNPWKLNDDGTMTVQHSTGDIQSKQKFRDVFVHVEYVTPEFPSSSNPTGHERGNSGVLLNSSYELQIIDLAAFGLEPTPTVCGAVYGVSAPLYVACHEQTVWNTYEIEFQAPTCDDVNRRIVKIPARFVEVKLNGTVIHRNVDVLGHTQAGQAESCEPQGLRLQDWSSALPVSFRNIWAIPRG